MLFNDFDFELPSKREIYFDSDNHRYTDDFNTNYISVTTLIKRYEIPFEREYWLKYKAKQIGISPKELSKKWDTITLESQIKGTDKHEYLENNINSFYTPTERRPINDFSFKGGLKVINIEYLNNSDLQFKHNEIYNYLVDLINKGFTLYSEKRVYNYQIGISGTIDVLAVKGKQFIIVDWKTNKHKLEFKSGYYKKNEFGIKTNRWVNTNDCFKKPLSNIPFCKGEVYTLQLSLYAFLTELFDFECIGLNLWHIQDNEPDCMYKIKYRKNDVINMLIDYYNKK